MDKLAYRPEIDGLRAIAVTSVVAFHAGFEPLAGGFIGVDVFFVISGYLITKIIFSRLQEENFSFSEFYTRRMKRIFPAAVFMVSITLLSGALLLTPDKYIELSYSAVFSNLFLANVWFLNHSGYFDLSTEVSPLAHMWSLAVEEQFYSLFPVALFVFYRLGKTSGVLFFVLFVSILLLVLSILLSPIDPHFSFYMLPTRGWELGIGSCLAFVSPLATGNRSHSNLISVSGAAAIAYGLLFISKDTTYPGYMALFPTLGTGLIIYATASSGTVTKSILTTPLLVFLGRISYSTYLWHWPIIVYYRVYVNERDFSSQEICLLVLASVLAGYLSWKYVEERFRYLKVPRKRVFSHSFLAVTLSMGVAGSVIVSQGMPMRVSKASTEVTDIKRMWKWTCTEEIRLFKEIEETFCVVGVPWKEARRQGLVWGDSHSQHWAQLLDQEAKRIGLSLVIAPTKCPPYLVSEHVKSFYPEFPNFTKDCTLRNRLTETLVSDNDEIEVVIMAAAWSGHVRMLYTDDVPVNKSTLPLESKSAEVGAQLSDRALRALLSNLDGKQILLLGDVPRPNRTLNECAVVEHAQLLREKCSESDFKWLDAKAVQSWHGSSDAVLRSIANDYANVQVIIPADHLCDSERCSTFINDELIYKDGNHIRRNLREETARQLARVIGLSQWFSALGKR